MVGYEVERKGRGKAIVRFIEIEMQGRERGGERERERENET